MVVEAQPTQTERIGKFEFNVVYEPDASPDRDEQRVAALTAWLLAEWQREQEAREQHVASTSDN